jgi:hypothetical protein
MEVNEIYEVQTLTINMAVTKLTEIFSDNDFYEKLSYEIATGNKIVKNLVVSIEKTVSRINRLCISYQFKRSFVFIALLKTLINKLKTVVT